MSADLASFVRALPKVELDPAGASPASLTAFGHGEVGP